MDSDLDKTHTQAHTQAHTLDVDRLCLFCSEEGEGDSEILSKGEKGPAANFMCV